MAFLETCFFHFFNQCHSVDESSYFNGSFFGLFGFRRSFVKKLGDDYYKSNGFSKYLFDRFLEMVVVVSDSVYGIYGIVCCRHRAKCGEEDRGKVSKRMEEILRVENLSVQYYATSGKRQRGIQNINFSLQKGGIYGIIGESGSGKSTLLLALLGLLEDKAEIKGKIFYQGEEIQNLPEKEKKRIRFEEIAIIFQNQLDRLNPSLTVEEQILEIIRKKFSKKKEQEKRLLELFQKIGRASCRERV